MVAVASSVVVVGHGCDQDLQFHHEYVRGRRVTCFLGCTRRCRVGWVGVLVAVSVRPRRALRASLTPRGRFGEFYSLFVMFSIISPPEPRFDNDVEGERRHGSKRKDAMDFDFDDSENVTSPGQFITSSTAFMRCGFIPQHTLAEVDGVVPKRSWNLR